MSTRAIRVKMEATFLLRTYMPDWRDDRDLDVAARVLGALFEDVDLAVEGTEVGPCTCPAPDVEELLTGVAGKPDPSCPWHGDRT